jgi:hypothetical protein
MKPIEIAKELARRKHIAFEDKFVEYLNAPDGVVVFTPTLFGMARATELGHLKRPGRLLLILLCFVLSGCVTGNLAMETGVMQYSGDGVIHSCSTILMPGYAIEFPKFNSTRSYQASYRLSNMPPAGRERALILLRFNQPGLLFSTAQRKQKSVTATFRFSLLDAKGDLLHSAELQLCSAIWTGNQRVPYGIYELGKSHFHFERNASYILHVSYTPGAVPPPAKELYFAIDNCGFY